MKRLLGIFLMAASVTGFAQSKANMWDVFAKTKFEPKYDEKSGEYKFFPTFPADLKALEGKEITIQGFYIPFAPEDGKYIVISKFPMSQCFFCGNGGPESITEVYLKTTPRFQVDDLITIRGKLKLNATDADHLTFIAEQAVLVDK